MSEEKELFDESVDTVEEQPETDHELVEEVNEEAPSTEENEYSAVEEEETSETEETDDTEAVEETVEETAEVEEAPEIEAALEEENKDDSVEPIFTHTEEEFTKLTEELESLRAEVQELRDFKLGVENQQKDALIASYYMLSDEDKAEVVAHKAEFTLEEIKAKLAVIYVEKNVNFDMIEGQEEVEETAPAMTFSLDEEASEGVPAFVEALRHTLNN